MTETLSGIQTEGSVFIQFGNDGASTRAERHTSYEEYRTNFVKLV